MQLIEGDFADYRPGDVVVAKCGGPFMVVIKRRAADEEMVLDCMWMTAEKVIRQTVPEVCVRIIPTEVNHGG